MTTDNPWTTEIVNALRNAWTAGHSAKAIARELTSQFPGYCFTANAVLGKKNRLGLEARLSPIKLNGPQRPYPDRCRKIPLPPLIEIMERAPASKPLPVALVPVAVLAPRQPIGRTSNCQWPLWDDKPVLRADFTPLLCGAPQARGSYCECHARIAYVTIPKRVAA